MPNVTLFVLILCCGIGMLLAGMVLLNRGRQAHGHECTSCGYDFRGSGTVVAKCPECGTWVMEGRFHAGRRATAMRTAGVFLIVLGLLMPTCVASCLTSWLM